jgi:nitrite reductase/ring-hydroxylating ferredoxin subunit
MTEHVVASAEELDESERVIVDVEGREVAVFNLDGEYHAVLNWCAHQGGPCGVGLLSGTITSAKYNREEMNVELEWGKDGEILNCPWHAWEYDIKTGECLSRQGVTLPTFPAREQDGEIIVET